MNLSKLNDMQKEAVCTTKGPVLILAGAGSGKTTVLVNRIAYMIEHDGVFPYNILAITFTNKAANEMKTRIEALMGKDAEKMWVCTFHSCCVRILRSCIEKLGFMKNFVIYDSDDSKTVIKDCLKELNLDDKIFNPRSVSSKISKAKDEMIDPISYEKINQKDYRLSKIAQVYTLYQEKLKKNNALDFDDLIFFTVKILKENPDILESYRQRFKYIMVDEYQDTSTAQYMLISLLSGVEKNICVVGDDDQSIYKFRGANIRNILDFEKEFNEAKIIKLEQNYRSTKNILDAANKVIKNNMQRKTKALWTGNDEGDKITIFTGYNEREEAQFIADEIEKAVSQGAKHSDFAILYRTNAQSRVIEDTFIRNVIPYKILSGLRFYDRKEIKDIIAYLRVILNSDDDVSLQRIINEPKRGIGKTTMDKALFLSGYHNKSLYKIISNAKKYHELSRSEQKFAEFCSMIENFKKLSYQMDLTKFIEKVLLDTGYMSVLEIENTIEAQTRIENIKEFISVAAEFEKNEEEASFEAFLENVTLVSSVDMYDEEEDYVVMMTIHSAKGLEFPKVFIAGMEDGLFPSLKGVSQAQDEEDLEEERRLCYVAITRAKEKLYMTNAQQRTVFGQTTYQRPSRFIMELGNENINKQGKENNDVIRKKQSGFFDIKPVKITMQNENTPKETYNSGDIVFHNKFGKGMVITAKSYGKDTLVEVMFDDVGKKQLMANFAKLKKEE